MDPIEALTTLGGVSTRTALLRATTRSELDRALAGGRIVVLARNRYALPDVDVGVARAHALSGVLGFTSAALHHGWAVKIVPTAPHVIVPRRRKVAAPRRHGVQVHYQDLLPEDIVDGIATTKPVTLLHCLRRLPFDEALSVADSALRSGEQSALRQAAAWARGPGSPQVRRVAAAARGEADNPFESTLRAIAMDVPGLDVAPQVLITSTTPWCRPDLVDRDRRIVLEADSFQWHGDRVALARDARRYNLLVADGWLVLRFAWEDVMLDPLYVRDVLAALVDGRAQAPCPRCRPA